MRQECGSHWGRAEGVSQALSMSVPSIRPSWGSSCHECSDCSWTGTRTSAFLSKSQSRSSSPALGLASLLCSTSNRKRSSVTSTSLNIFHSFQWSEQFHLKTASYLITWSSSKFIIRCNLCSRLEGMWIIKEMKLGWPGISKFLVIKESPNHNIQVIGD